MPAKAARSRVGSIAIWVSRALGIGLLLVLATLAVVLIALELPSGRAYVTRKVNALLEGSFAGRLEIESFRRAGFFGVEGVNARLFDAQGRRVAMAAEARVDIDLPRLLFSLMGSGPLLIRIPEIRVAHAELRLIDDGKGSPTFISAFDPPAPSPLSSEASSLTLVDLENVQLNHIWVHGGLASAPALDVDLLAVRGSLSVGQERTTVRVERLGLTARAVPLVDSVAGQLALRLAILTPTKKSSKAGENNDDLFGNLTFNGWLAEPGVAASERSSIHLGAELKGKSVVATVKVSPLGRPLMQRLAPRVRLAERSELTLRVQGNLPALDVRAEVLSGPASVRIVGHIEAFEPLKGKLEVAARGVDAATIDPDAPSSRLNLDLNSSFNSNKSALQANYAISIFQSEVSSIELPPTTIHGDLNFGFKNQNFAIDGALIAHEPGAPTKAQFAFQAPKGTLQITASSVLTRPRRLALLLPGLKANGGVDVTGSANIYQKTMLFEASAQLASIVLAGGSTPSNHSIEHASVRVKAEGAFANPNFRALIAAEDIQAAGQHLRTARLQVGGTPRELVVFANITSVDDRTLHADTKIALTDGVELRQLRIAYTDQRLALTGGAQRVKIAQGRVSVEQAEFAGAGELKLSGVFSDSLERLELESRNLDVGRLLTAFTSERWLKGARADLTAKYQLGRAGANGGLKGAITGIGVDRLQNGSVRLDVNLESGLLSGPIEAKLGDNGTFTASLERVGPLNQAIDRGDLLELRGGVKAQGRVRLERLFKMLGPDVVPLDSARGTLTFDLDAVAENREFAKITARVRTQKLSLVGRRISSGKIETAAEARETRPWALEGIDVDTTLSTSSGEHPKLTGRLFDVRGDLVTFEVLAPGPLSRSVEAQALLRDFRTLPWEARLRIPGHDLEHLPEVLKLPGWAGVVSGAIEARGTLTAPEVTVAFTAKNLKPSEFGAKKSAIPPLDVKLDGAYRDNHGTLRVEASSRERAQATAFAEWQGSPLAMSQIGQSEVSPITGRMNVELVEFPVDIIPTLRARGLSGRLSAKAALTDFGSAAAFNAEIAASNFKVGEAKSLDLGATLSLQGSALLAKASLRQSSGTSSMTFRSGATWGDRLMPQVSQPMSAELELRQLGLSAFQPLVIDQVTDLGGQVDAQIRVDLSDTRSEARGWIRLNDGSVSVPAVGQRFDRIRANIALIPGKVVLSDFTAHGISGKLTAKGNATFSGVEPTSAALGVSVKKNEKIPITIEGMAVGDMWGRISLRYQPGKGDTRSVLDVDVPKMHLELAATPPNSVQSLEPAEGVRIGVRFPDRFANLPLQPLLHEADSTSASVTPLIRVVLGNDVTITKGTDLNAKLSGNLAVESEMKTRVSGQIHLQSGTIDVSGKQFQIERGIVTFRPDENASNPTIVATARWDSPTEYSVFAEYSGPVENGKLTLRAEPPLAEDQILTLILFGTPDGNVGSGGGSNASAAAGLVGGTATKGLNRALAKVSNLDVSTRVDTSTGSSRPELVVQITPRVAARVTRALAEPTAGQSPDRTFVTLDFRLFRKWSLAAQVGDQGASALDLVWRHRY